MNWNVILNNAIENEPTQAHYGKLRFASMNWVTCAVGNQCSVIPRHKEGEPLDRTLRNLGISFTLDIENKNWNKAKYTLSEIEQRSGKLMAKLSI